MGSGKCTSITLAPLGSAPYPTGQFDEALYYIYNGSIQTNSQIFYYGPQFTICDDATGLINTTYGTDIGNLEFNGVAPPGSVMYFFFVPATAWATGSPASTGIVHVEYNVDFGANAPTGSSPGSPGYTDAIGKFMSAVNTAIANASPGGSANSTFWTNYFYLFGEHNLQNQNAALPNQNVVGGTISTVFNFEIIPLLTPLNFGNGNETVSMNVVFNPSTSIFSNTNGVLNVTGTPPLNLSINVALLPVTCMGISLNAANLTVAAGGTSQLTASLTPSNCTDQNVSWSSSNTAVATVTGSGLVTVVGGATSSQTAIITATSDDGGLNASCALTVK